MIMGHSQGIVFIVCLAAFFDFADGYLARRFNVQTKLGCYLDTISDFICFVLVPALFVVRAYQETLTVSLAVVSILYVVAGAARLIRYTLSKLRLPMREGFFVGCPVTAVALCVVSAVGLYANQMFHAVLLCVCAYCMISKIEYVSFSKIVHSSNMNGIRFFIYVFLFCPFGILYPLACVFFLSCAYLLFFPVWHLVNCSGGAQVRIRRLWLFPFAQGTRRIIVACAACAFLSFFFLSLAGAIVYCVILSAMAFFFRDPERISGTLNLTDIVSPADGRVMKVERHLCKQTGKVFQKISIFLSLFDVHVNRAPIQLRVLACEHRAGSKLDARHPRAGENEHNLFTCEIHDGKTIMVKQIAGKFARRILSYVNEGSALHTAQRMGVIMFGSRVEIFLPEKTKVFVKTGDVVKAGMTTIAAII